MNTIGIDSGFALSGNPVLISCHTPLGGSAGITRLVVDMEGGRLHECLVTPPVTVNISEIIDEYIPFITELPAGNTQPVYRVETETDWLSRTVDVWAENDEGDKLPAVSFKAFRGGISNQNIRLFADAGQDVFTSRFCNYSGNFFLTTRSWSWRVVIKETELEPLYFVFNRSNGKLKIVDKSSGESSTYVISSKGVYAIDVKALRRSFFDTLNVLSSSFDIYVDDAFSCSVVISRSAPATERRLLRFRNSFGVFESMEIVGEMKASVLHSEDEDRTFSRYDAITDGFISERLRPDSTLSYSCSIVLSNRDSCGFIMDMLGSDEVYLIGLAAPVRVIPSVDEFSYNVRPVKPENINVVLTVDTSETFGTQNISSVEDSRKPKIFSEQFSNQFN